MEINNHLITDDYKTYMIYHAPSHWYGTVHKHFETPNIHMKRHEIPCES